MNWATDADRLLIALWNAGGSLQSIAADMAKAGYADVTRNAVAGRKHRLPSELFQRQRKPQPPVRLPMPKPVKIKQPEPQRLKPKPVVERKHSGPKVEYINATEDQCKAILPERGKEWDLPMVCGWPRAFDAEGCRTSYCAHHLSLYYPAHRRT